MSTVIRPEVSTKNPYWIEKERHYELVHFCRQYPIWVKAHEALDGLSKRPGDLEVFTKTHNISDPTARCAIAKEHYRTRIEMVEKAALEADPELAEYIVLGVTQGLSYDVLNARLRLPCGKDTYYDRYRKFFWILSKARD